MSAFDLLIHDTIEALPIIGWAILGLILLCWQIVCGGKKSSLLIAALGLVVLAAWSLSVTPMSPVGQLFSGLIVFDGWASTLNLMAIGIFLGIVLMLAAGLSINTKLFQKSYEQFPELLICLMFSGFGLAVLIAASDLSSLFLGLETFSIGLYCACGFYRTEMRSTESGFKYLMIGAFSTVLFLFGLSFLFGATGATSFDEISRVLGQGLTLDQMVLVQLACVFLIAAFGFKLSLVPFHFYTPEVYEGAPTPITCLLTTAVKVGAFGAAFRLFSETLISVDFAWKPLLLALCLLSVIFGNIMAIQQKSLKKLFAFSSIAHSGFIALALLVASKDALLFYLFVYAAMNLGLFSLLTYLENREQVFLVEDLKGLANKKIGLAFLFALFVLGLAGFPPFAGFMVKFWILNALISADYMWVSLVAVIGSLIGAAYYLRLLMLIFMSEESGNASAWENRDFAYLLRMIIFVGAIVTLVGALRPQIYADWILATIALK